MIFVKFCILGTIFGICSYLGFSKSKTLEKRVLELLKFENSLVMFKSKLQFTYEPIKNIFEEISKVIYNNEENIFLYTVNGNQNIYESWCNGVQKNNYLNKEDKEVIKMMGKLMRKNRY